MRGQERIVLDFQHAKRAHSKRRRRRIEEIPVVNAASDARIKRDAHIAKRFNKGSPLIIHVRFRAEQLAALFDNLDEIKI